MSRASLQLFLIGTGWMNQSASMTQVLPLERPFESSAEARDAIQSIKKELLATGIVSPEAGLIATTHSYGDFASITDVRIDYIVKSQSTGQGVFGETTTFTTTLATALEFNDPDSEFLLNDEED